MNSVEQARAKKRAAMPVGSTSTTAATSAPRSVIPAPPKGENVNPANLLSSSTSSGSFSRRPLPSLGSNSATHMSPKTSKYAATATSVVVTHNHGRKSLVDDLDDDAIDDLMRHLDARMPTDDGTRRNTSSDDDEANVTPSDPMDSLSPEERAEAEQSFGHRVTPEYLRDRTGFEDLQLVLTTELKIDVRRLQGADCIGELMPRLTELRLNHSFVPSFRDLGTKFSCLQILHLNNSHLKELRGVAACRELRELYVAFNALTTLTDVGSLAKLEVLDAEGNQISDADDLYVLRSLDALISLNLSGNPIEFAWETSSQRQESEPGMTFRGYVRDVVPQLKSLDDAALEGPQVAALLNAKRFVDPLSADLAQELFLVQASIRSNVHPDYGLEGAIEEQNRRLYSRQSTSCAGARKRTSGETSREGTAPRQRTADRGIKVSSAPPDGLRSPHKGTVGQQRETHSSDSATGAPPTNIFSKSAFLRSVVPAPVTSQAASSLTSGGSMFSGNLVKSLRRRLPSIPGTGKPTTLLPENESDTGGDHPQDKKILREHELLDRLRQIKEQRQASGVAMSTEENEELDALLEELGEHLELECAMGNDDDELERFKREEFLGAHANGDRPLFFDKYKDMIAEMDEVDKSDPQQGCGGGDTGNTQLSEPEIVAAVAKLKMQTLRQATDELVQNPGKFESLKMSDLGEDIDGVL